MQQRFKAKAKALFHKGKGMNVAKFIRFKLNPMLRGWINYYIHCNVKGFPKKHFVSLGLVSMLDLIVKK
jgi:hypothetical protein